MKGFVDFSMQEYLGTPWFSLEMARSARMR